MKSFEHPFYEETHGEFTWCLHCERASETEEWVNNEWECPHDGCNGSALDAFPWEADTWPRRQHPEYPEVPQEGVYYPLYGEKKN